MPSNIGKNFELDFKRSTPPYALIHRLSDSAQAFGGNNNLRFSIKNPFDYLMWDSKRRILYALELKTVAGKSISFERSKDEKGEIHFHQIKGLNKWNKFNATICGFIIEFRKIEKTFFLSIDDFNKLINLISKKSFSNDDLICHDIKHTVITQRKKITRYTYDVDSFLENMSTNGDLQLN